MFELVLPTVQHRQLQLHCPAPRFNHSSLVRDETGGLLCPLVERGLAIWEQDVPRFRARGLGDECARVMRGAPALVEVLDLELPRLVTEERIGLVAGICG